MSFTDNEPGITAGSISALVAALIALVVAFGAPVTDQQKEAILSVVAIVAPIARALGATHAMATRMVVEDGRYTGEIAFYCYGDGKVEAIRQLADREGYALEHCYAYSDSITDLPMLETVGHPAVVNPDRGLRKEAAAVL